MENWMFEISSLNGKEKLQAILEKNLDSQETHYLDDVMSVHMKSAEFVLAYMQDYVCKDAHLISEIIKQGISDGSLATDYPDKLLLRLKFLQNMMKSVGIDVLTDAVI